MKTKRFSKIISFVASLSIILQSILPFTLALPVYAEDATASSQLESSLETVLPTPEPTDPQTQPTPVPAGETTPETSLSQTEITYENVSLNTPYVLGDTGVSVTFSRLPEQSGSLTIKQITLTEEQIITTNALSDKAYDITSSMPDGSFEYDLVLPKPSESEIEVKYSENGTDFSTTGGVRTTADEVIVEDLSHFTIFVVSGTQSTPAVRINEFVYNPQTGSEWVELYNAENNPINLTGYRLVDRAGNTKSLSGNLPSKGFVAIDVNFLNNTPDSLDGDKIELQKRGFLGFYYTIDEISYVRCDGLLCFAIFSTPISQDNLLSGKSIGRTVDGGSSWKVFNLPTKSASNLGDTTPPTATISYSTTLPTEGPVTATITPSEPVVMHSEGGMTHQFTDNGSFTFVFEDNWGNLGQVEAVVANIDTTAPETPVLLSPADNTFRPTSDSNYSDWSDVSDYSGVYYHYQSSPDTSFTSLYYDSENYGQLNESMIMNPGEPEVTYYWRVRACDSLNHCSPWTEPWKINIDNSSPSKPVISSPANNYLTNTSSVSLSWTGGDDSGSGLKGYHVNTAFISSDGTESKASFSDLIVSSEKTHNYIFGFGEGRYTISIKSVDKLGHVSEESDPVVITYDISAPTFISSISFLPSSPTNNLNIVWSWDSANDKLFSSGLKYYNWSLFGNEGFIASGMTSDTSLNTTLPAEDGDYLLQVVAEDNLGHLSTINSSSEVTLDTTSPDVTITAPVSSYINTSSLEIRGSVTDLHPHHYWLVVKNSSNVTVAGPGTVNDTESFTDKSLFTWDISSVPDGNYSIRLEARDSANNKDSGSVAVKNITLDRTAPVSTISSPTEGTFHNQPIVISGNTTDQFGVSGTVLSYATFNGETCSEYTPIVNLSPEGETTNFEFSYTWTPEQGRYCLKAQGTDLAQNEEHTSVITDVTYDTVTPSVNYTETNPADETLSGNSTQTFSVEVSEEVRSCTLNFNGNYVERISGNTISDGSGFNYIIGGDDTARYYTLPFQFPFYGNNYSAFSISTNSLIDFRSTYNASYPGSVPQLINTTGISTLWTDLVTSIYSRNESDAVRFRWTGSGWATGGYLTNEAVLHRNGNIELLYGSVNLPSRSVTVGISSGNGHDYTLSSVNGRSSISPISFIYSPGAEASYPMSKNEDGTYSVTVPDIADGIITYQVTCTDFASNEGQSNSRTITIDTTAPVVQSKTTYEGWYKEDQESLFIFEDVNGIEGSNSATCMITTEGENQTCSIEPTICDVVGNCTSGVFTSNGANIDKANPIVNLTTSPAIPDGDNGWFKTKPEITLELIDSNPDVLLYSWNQAEGEFSLYESKLTPPSEGVNILYYRAYDKAGNETGLLQKEIKFDQTDLDNGPQNLTASPNPTNSGKSTIKWESAKDNIGIDRYEVTWTFNGTTPVTNKKTVASDVRELEITDLQEGRYTVSVRAFDQAGHNKDQSLDLYVDTTIPSSPTLSLLGTGLGSATLSWSEVADAVDYIIWYGQTSGSRQFGARVGKVNSFTVQGLGAGDYYFIVRAVDNAQNQSSESNEVSTGTIEGAPGVEPNTPAEGFSPEVKGTNTDDQSQNSGKGILGINTDGRFPWWWLLLAIPAYFILRRVFKKK